MINIDDELMRDAMKATGATTKTEAIKMGLREIVAAHRRKELASLFGKAKNQALPPRRRPM